MSIFSKLFGSSKKDATYRGPEPYASLEQAKGGRESLEELKRRLRGEGVGFGANYADRAASPVIARMRNTYNTTVRPELESELTLTGRRRGSAGFDQLRRSLMDQSFAEGDVWSGLYQQDEAQKRNEINDALDDIQEFARADAGQQGAYVGHVRGLHDAEVARADARRAAESEGMKRLGQAGLSIAAAPFTGGASLAALPAVTSASSHDYSGMASNPRANIGYGRSGNSLNQRLAMKRALMGGYR